MHKMAVILFALAVLLKPVLPVVEYLVNYDYIVTELCINKDKKNLQCKGKCHLKTKLAEASGDTQKNVPDNKAKHSYLEILFFAEIPNLIPFKTIKPAGNHFGNYADLYSYAAGDRLFHPPALRLIS